MLLIVAALAFSARRAASRLSVLRDSPEPAAPIWNTPVAWLIAAFGFLNIGVESGLGGWLTTYSNRLQAEGRMWFNATILFFAFLVIGRGLASVISRWVTENQLLIGCTITLVFGVGLILMTNNPVTPLAGAAVAGLGTSAIFPTNVVRFTNLFGPSATRQATPLFVTGTVGAAVLSSLVGLYRPVGKPPNRPARARCQCRPVARNSGSVFVNKAETRPLGSVPVPRRLYPLPNGRVSALKFAYF